MIKLTKKYLVYLTLMTTSSQAEVYLTKSQEQIIKKAYDYGLKLKASDGMTFQNTLAGIVLRESSAGKNIADPLHDSIGVFQIRPKVAEKIIRQRLPQFKHLLLNKKKLLLKLLTNVDFSLIIAGEHILMHYEEAKRRGMWNPWYRTVSRYNGGWFNKTYVKAVSKDIAFLLRNKIIKKSKKK